MQENYFILVTSTNLLSLYRCKSNFFPVKIPNSHVKYIYGRSVERSVVEADFTYIKNALKNPKIFYP